MKLLEMLESMKTVSESLIAIDRQLTDICESLEWEDWKKFCKEYPWVKAFNTFEATSAGYAVMTEEIIDFVDEYFESDLTIDLERLFG